QLPYAGLGLALTGALPNGRCDAALGVSAPAWRQRQRVLRRPGMTRERLAAILAKQMPDAEKRRRADAVIPTGLGKRLTWRRLGQDRKSTRLNSSQQISSYP